MAKTNQRGRNNNNPNGHNQYTNEWLAPVKDHPFASAAAAAAAVGAGVFLWSKRNQVGNQVNKISRTANEMGRKASEKASDWMDQMQSKSPNREVALTDGPNESAAIEASRRTSSRTSSRATGGQSKSNANMTAGRAGASTVSY